MMKIHRIETGKVRVKKSQITRKKSLGPSMASVLFDGRWSDWLPIYAWAIEHPEGVIVVDTGETYRTKSKKYLPGWHPYYAMAVDFDVSLTEEIGPQLTELGINQFKDVTKVIMTHMHTDHAGGLYHFPGSEIIINHTEFKAGSGINGIMAGYLPHRWPKWLNPTIIKFAGSKLGPFNNSFSVTKDRKVIIVSTPGHSKGHMSVIVEMEDYFYFLAGDASYNENNMLQALPDGIGNKQQSIDTLKRIRSFAERHPTIYLPSHDPDVPIRMDAKIIAPNYLNHLSYKN